jgi:hypothetical protein
MHSCRRARIPSMALAPLLLLAGALVGAGQAVAAPAIADVSGSWSVTWCDRQYPEKACGGFTAHLVQKGDRVCGTHNAASPGLSMLDDGADRSLVGRVVGQTAIVALRSGRNEAVHLVSLRKRQGALHWQRREVLQPAAGDADVLADRAVLARLKTAPGDERRQAMQAACESYWRANP